MCYGMGCQYESTYYGPDMGTCRKPGYLKCPQVYLEEIEHINEEIDKLENQLDELETRKEELEEELK